MVTLGAEGALWTDGARTERVGAVAAEVIDTTGAGDAFTAGLLVARLAGRRAGRGAGRRRSRGGERRGGAGRTLACAP